MPKNGILSMQTSANGVKDYDVANYFGFLRTEKTTLSADSKRKLIGDDEHCRIDDRVFNIEGVCYTKCINLSEYNEPDIYMAIRFGTVLGNVD